MHVFPFRHSFIFFPASTLAAHMIEQHRMLSPLSISSSDVLIQDSKFPSSSHLYLRQQHTVQIIQLVEGPPPSPRPIGYGSVASSSDYSSDDSQSLDDEDEESVCSSYCSSDLPSEQPNSPPCNDDSSLHRPGSHSSPLKRILAWRENFSSQLSATLSNHSLSSSLKRKIQFEGDDDLDDDSASHSSKRSRSRSLSQSSLGNASAVSIDMHSCPACDASFPTPQSLRQHGRDAEATNEACTVAVEYAFE